MTVSLEVVGFPSARLCAVLCSPLIHKEAQCVQLCFTKSIHWFPIAILHADSKVEASISRDDSWL